MSAIGQRFSNSVFSIIVDQKFCTNSSLINGNKKNQGRGLNSRFTYVFNTPVTLPPDARIGIRTLSVPFAWRNITEFYGNNKFSYKFNNITRDLTIPDGYYDSTSLYAWMRGIMNKCGDYLINANGDYVYFWDFGPNLPIYRNQFNSYAVNTTLPNGWLIPATWGSLINDSTVQSSGSPGITRDNANTFSQVGVQLGGFYIIVPSGEGKLRTLYQFFGLYPSNSGKLPLQASTFAYNNAQNVSEVSDKAPRTTDVDQCILTSPQVKNVFTSPIEAGIGTDVITSFSINCAYGENIIHENFFTMWMPFVTSSMSEFDIAILDQYGRDVYIEDISTTIEFMITNGQGQ